jgi:hypothetical protein
VFIVGISSFAIMRFPYYPAINNHGSGLTCTIQEGRTLENCLPYLCRHLGHASVANSWYYYHVVEKALPIILDKDLLGVRIIPEVRYEDEIE